MSRAYLSLALVLTACSLAQLVASPASAQEEEARALFERGNEHLARGMRGPEARRERELGEAVDAYLGVLRLGARTRNVIFNLGLASEGLARHNDAFNYFAEYLRTFDLTPDEREEGARRLAAVRASVAVLDIRSTPEGAEVRLERSDLPVRGHAPLEIAVNAGQHIVLMRHAGYRPSTTTSIAAVGESTEVQVAMVPEPVMVQVIAPSGGRLTLDGQAIVAGRSIPVDPGAHVARLEVEGAPPVERRFEVAPASEPMVLELRAPTISGPRLTVRVDREADVFLDEVPIGHGLEAETASFPGPHRVRISAAGFVTAQHAINLAQSDRLQLEVALAPMPDRTGLHAARATLGITTAVALSVAVGFAIQVVALDAEWDRALAANMNGEPGAETPEQLEARADEIEDWALATDILLAVTGAIGIGAIIASAVSEGAPESTVEIAAAAGPSSVVLAVRGSL